MFTELIEIECGSNAFYEVQISVMPDSSSVAPSIACEETMSSISFSWTDGENADEYEVEVMTGQAGELGPDGLSYTVDGLLNDEEVTISVTAINNTSCGSDAEVLISCTALPSATDDQERTGFRIYPNPTSDLLIVNHDQNQDCKVLKILDPRGLSIEVKLDDKQIDVSELFPGVYLLAIQIDQAIHYVRFLKI
jgi:hypothetical protein